MAHETDQTSLQLLSHRDCHSVHIWCRSRSHQPVYAVRMLPPPAPPPHSHIHVPSKGRYPIVFNLAHLLRLAFSRTAYCLPHEWQYDVVANCECCTRVVHCPSTAWPVIPIEAPSRMPGVLNHRAVPSTTVATRDRPTSW